MPDRTLLRTAFLTNLGWAGAEVSNLAGDASNRRYFRLVHPESSALCVLMDAPPEKGEDVTPFVEIARHLSHLRLSPPTILAEDPTNGFLLLEDLGDDLFARVLVRAPDQELQLYAAAVDVLAELHKAPLPRGIGAYDPNLMADLATLAFDWYLQGVTGHPDPKARATFKQAFTPLLTGIHGWDEVLIQRDYHAENLLWLPDRTGVARVGLLDFQDALAGHRAYDLVSLLQDARRDILPGTQSAMIDRYLAETGVDPIGFHRAYRLLGVQRNMRIIGVFARLCLRDAKPGYLDLLPRVWAHLKADLNEPFLAELESIITLSLPEPGIQEQEALRQKCGTLQQPS